MPEMLPLWDLEASPQTVTWLSSPKSCRGRKHNFPSVVLFLVDIPCSFLCLEEMERSAQPGLLRNLLRAAERAHFLLWTQDGNIDQASEQVATLESIQKGNLVSQPAQEVFLQASQLF